MKQYKASPALESFILNQAPPHEAVCNAPNSWEALKACHSALKFGERLPVYDGGSHNTIYSHARYNYAFRAWHDKIHLDLNADFTKLGEIRVSNEHGRQLDAHRIMFNLTDEDKLALRYDVAGQVLYYYKYGEFVNDQAAFVQACFDAGSMFTVLNTGDRY